MRHRKKKKILGRKSDQRRMLIRNLANDFILKGKIKTTSAKAKVLKSFIEKLITKSGEDNLQTKRYLESHISLKSSNKLIKDISPQYKDRKGGYTRIIKLKNRAGDNAPIVLIEFV